MREREKKQNQDTLAGTFGFDPKESASHFSGYYSNGRYTSCFD